ncbi:DUF4245 domain-containing protein [Aeromicrobium sp. CF4.19]|uniref:DUF4245 domain-containing protein n=1 Tax=Aeromicrobium sp. CF4.19 TaxID=3373082 RepID=UPI003EE5221E
MSGTSSRGNPSLGDIVRSVVVLGVLVLGVWGVAQVFSVTPERPVRGMDLEQTITAARPAVTAFDLLAPQSLPEDWIVTSARPEPDAWDLGVLTADDEYVGVQQALTSEDELVAERDAGFTRGDAVRIDGQEWTLWEAPGETAFTREDGEVATLVLGTAPREQVEAYVASLSSESS